MATEPAAGVWVGLGDEDEGVGGGVDDAAETVIKTTDVLGCGDGSLAQPVPAPRRTTQNAPQMMDQRLALRRVSIKLDHWAVESGSVRGSTTTNCIWCHDQAGLCFFGQYPA